MLTLPPQSAALSAPPAPGLGGTPAHSRRGPPPAWAGTPPPSSARPLLISPESLLRDALPALWVAGHPSHLGSPRVCVCARARLGRPNSAPGLWATVPLSSGALRGPGRGLPLAGVPALPHRLLPSHRDSGNAGPAPQQADAKGRKRSQRMGPTEGDKEWAWPSQPAPQLLPHISEVTPSCLGHTPRDLWNSTARSPREGLAVPACTSLHPCPRTRATTQPGTPL